MFLLQGEHGVGQCVHRVEALQRDAKGDEPEAGARPGEEGPFVGEVVSRDAAGGGEGGGAQGGEPFYHGWEMGVLFDLWRVRCGQDTCRLLSVA